MFVNFAWKPVHVKKVGINNVISLLCWIISTLFLQYFYSTMNALFWKWLHKKMLFSRGKKMIISFLYILFFSKLMLHSLLLYFSNYSTRIFRPWFYKKKICNNLTKCTFGLSNKLRYTFIVFHRNMQRKLDRECWESCKLQHEILRKMSCAHAERSEENLLWTDLKDMFNTTKELFPVWGAGGGGYHFYTNV
jgi:hypothetical protein